MQTNSKTPIPLILLDRHGRFRVSDNGAAWVVEEKKDPDILSVLVHKKPRNLAQGQGLGANWKGSIKESDWFTPSALENWRGLHILWSEQFRTLFLQDKADPKDEEFEWTEKSDLLQAIVSAGIQVDRHGRKSLQALWDSYDDYRWDCETYGLEAVLMHFDRRIIYSAPIDEDQLLPAVIEDFDEGKRSAHSVLLDLLEHGDAEMRNWIRDILAMKQQKKS